jgi:hypothetical protein
MGDDARERQRDCWLTAGLADPLGCDGWLLDPVACEQFGRIVIRGHLADSLLYGLVGYGEHLLDRFRPRLWSVGPTVCVR